MKGRSNLDTQYLLSDSFFSVYSINCISKEYLVKCPEIFHNISISTIRPGSLGPFYIGKYNIKWVNTSWDLQYNEFDLLTRMYYCIGWPRICRLPQQDPAVPVKATLSRNNRD